MRILLLGKNGQIGWELQRSLAPLGELIAPDRRNADFERPDALAVGVRSAAPQFIVNAAGDTAVDEAESQPARAHAVNAAAPALLAREAQATGAWLVHFSTDYVFDGSGTTAWTEDAPAAPLNVYGRSKLAGEQAIRDSGCKHLVLRTSWVYGVRGDNFARKLLRLAGERAELRVVADQVGAPTGAELIADVTAQLLRSLRDAPRAAGTYHLAAAGETSWHGYAEWLVEAARRAGWPVRASVIEAVPSSAYATAARRPLNSRLDTRKLRETFDLVLPPWQQGVQRVLAEWFDRR
jgi:dTDP-4-dehydrorhamnose reductase